MMHWYPEGQEGVVSGMRRAKVSKTDDSGAEQMLAKMTGMKTEQFENVYRAQSFGLSSHAPQGSVGLFLALGGRSDRLIGLGFEHKDHRPKNTPEGGTILYNDRGDVVRVFPDQMELYHAKTIKLSIGGGLKSSDDATCTIVMTKDALTITRGQSSVKIEDGQITHTSPHVIIKSDHVDLGDAGGTPVGLCGGGCATKVYAV
jgi:phage gp45-like